MRKDSEINFSQIHASRPGNEAYKQVVIKEDIYYRGLGQTGYTKLPEKLSFDSESLSRALSEDTLRIDIGDLAL